MEAITIQNLSFSYPNTNRPQLQTINLSIPVGEFVILHGPSGCGKSTLLSHLRTALQPHGQRSGQVLYYATPLEKMDLLDQTARIGFLRQSIEHQLITDKVWHELAFGLESLGYDNTHIKIKVAEMATYFGIHHLLHQFTHQLSGGQKQLVCLASIMALEPEILILDEPTSQLDPIAAENLFQLLLKLHREQGITILLSEHHLETIFCQADRILVMENGQLVANDSPRRISTLLSRFETPVWLALPTPIQLYHQIQNPLDCPISIAEGRLWLHQLSRLRPCSDPVPPVSNLLPKHSPATIQMTDIWFKYQKQAADTIQHLQLSVYPAQILALFGDNGSGKTTTLLLMAGLLRPYRGKIQTKSPRIGLLFQDPTILFTQKEVFTELQVSAKLSRSSGRPSNRLQQIADQCRLSHLFEQHPYDLSVGEQQRLALAKLLLAEPDILLFDEPTKGFDADFKKVLTDILRQLKQQGVTIVIASHDIDFCAQTADYCGLFFDGSLIPPIPTRDFFVHNRYFTSTTNKMAGHLLPTAINPEDVIQAFGSSAASAATQTALPTKPETTNLGSHDYNHPKPTSIRSSQRTLLPWLIVLLLIPATILIGLYLLDDRKYYFISLLVVIESMLPFFLSYEHTASTRRLVLTAGLTAIAIAGRLAFYMVPQFKPVLAIVIISGVSLGAPTGFMVGSLTAFLSNLFIGQGTWTPWQMFAFGIVGFVAGLLADSGFLRPRKISLAIYGGLSALFLCGLILDTSSALIWQKDISLSGLLPYYLTGLPFNLLHALSTILFLWLIGEPLLQKLERLKQKYGL